MEAAVPGFVHVQHPAAMPVLGAGSEDAARRVVVCGGGPVGLAVSLALARRGVPSLVVEADTSVCVGSRAICLSRRTLEILDRLGALPAFAGKGLPWSGGRSFYGREEVLHFKMPHDEDQRLAPMTNLQQYYIEQFLVDEIAKLPDLVEIRWGTSVTGVDPGASGVEVGLEAAGASYRVRADYVVACDGARSRIRQALGLRMSGTAYEGRYAIVDIELDTDLPTERLAWFDPPTNSGRTMLMHKQPDNIWRLDYALRSDEDPEVMIRPENVSPVVQAHLDMMGVDEPWRLVWTSTYRAAAVSLERYRVGRVLFAGDAAHLVPIFGVRGLNSGFDDAFNLGWKLALVLDGGAPETLLDSYSTERRDAWAFNVENAMKSTEFMAPPSRGFEIMREAVLSLAKDHPSLGTLINPRQSTAVVYPNSPLSTSTRDEPSFDGGPPPGAPIPECPLVVGGAKRFLTEILGEGFALLVRAGAEGSAEVAEFVRAAPRGVTVILVGGAGEPPPRDVAGLAGAVLAVDEGGRFGALFDAGPGAVYLLRPDGHVCARWRSLRRGDLASAMTAASGGSAAGCARS